MIRLFIRYLLASFSKRKKYFLYISYLYFSSHFPSNVLVKRRIFNYRIFPFFRGDYALRACIFIRFKMLAIYESTRACSSSGTWLRVINRGANTGQMCVCVILGSESREDLQPSRGQASGFGRPSPVATG